jgi:hypothetical protein
MQIIIHDKITNSLQAASSAKAAQAAAAGSLYQPGVTGMIT